MAEQPWQPTEAELERALVDLAGRLAYPPMPQLAESVRARLLAGDRPAWTPVRGLRQAVSLALLALALFAGAALALSPGTRTAVAEWFHLHGIELFYAPAGAPPVPVGTHLGLGNRVTLAGAQTRVGYHVFKPTTRWLGMPDEVYVGQSPRGNQVALVYRARRGLPRANTTGVGLLLTEFPGSSVVAAKFLEPDTRLSFVTVGGAPGFWISGKPHRFAYIDAQGVFRTESVRLAGNVLLWGRGGLVLRLESALPEGAALHIAASLR